MECQDCPMVVRIEGLENSHKDIKGKLSQIGSETKQNDRAITELSSRLAVHMTKSEARDQITHQKMTSIEKMMEDYREASKNITDSIKEHIDTKIQPIEDRLKPFDSVKLKNNIMWSILVSLLGAGLTLGIFVAQKKYEKYSEEDKKKYYEKRIEESQTIKEIKSKLSAPSIGISAKDKA